MLVRFQKIHIRLLSCVHILRELLLLRLNRFDLFLQALSFAGMSIFDLFDSPMF